MRKYHDIIKNLSLIFSHSYISVTVERFRYHVEWRPLFLHKFESNLNKQITEYLPIPAANHYCSPDTHLIRRNLYEPYLGPVEFWKPPTFFKKVFQKFLSSCILPKVAINFQHYWMTCAEGINIDRYWIKRTALHTVPQNSDVNCNRNKFWVSIQPITYSERKVMHGPGLKHPCSCSSVLINL